MPYSIHTHWFFFKLNPSAFLNLSFSHFQVFFFLDYEAANQQRQVRTLSLIPFKFPILTWSPHTVAIRFSGAVKKQEVTFHGFEEYAGLDLGYSWLNTMAKQTTQRRRSQVKTEQIRSDLLASLCIRALKFGFRLLSTEPGERAAADRRLCSEFTGVSLFKSVQESERGEKHFKRFRQRCWEQQGGQSVIWSRYSPTHPRGQVPPHHTAPRLICTSVLSLALKPTSGNQANVFPLRGLLGPPVNIGFPQQGTADGVKAFHFLCSKPPPENGGSKLSVHI